LTFKAEILKDSPVDFFSAGMTVKSTVLEVYAVPLRNLRRFVRGYRLNRFKRIPTHPLTPIDLFQPPRKEGVTEFQIGLTSHLRHDLGQN
ncbi:hypothetical protein, partial [Halorubrum ezzemoulense]|uniref:hypothetical protein n=1 Tax=Halorubrum ezzemoulense TaxID=337243 RepID=UPI001C3E60EF